MFRNLLQEDSKEHPSDPESQLDDTDERNPREQTERPSDKGHLVAGCRPHMSLMTFWYFVREKLTLICFRYTYAFIYDFGLGEDAATLVFASKVFLC